MKAEEEEDYRERQKNKETESQFAEKENKFDS